MLIWNEHDRELHEASSIHQSPVKVVQWSSNGNRLVTCDQVRSLCTLTGLSLIRDFFSAIMCIVVWLNLQVVKTKEILCSDWLLEWQDGWISCIDPLRPIFCRSRQLDIGLVLLRDLIGLDLVHNKVKKY